MAIPEKSLCIFKQYVHTENKPFYLHTAETIHLTLSGSLGFVVAFSWNDFFKAVFERMARKATGLQFDADAKSVASEQIRFKLIYAIFALAFLFAFNMIYSAVLTKMRSDAQCKALKNWKHEKDTKKNE